MLHLVELLAGDVGNQHLERCFPNVRTELQRLDLAIWPREAVANIQEADLARRCPFRQIPDFPDRAIGNDVFSRDPSGDVVATLARRHRRFGLAPAPAAGDFIEVVEEVVPILVVELLDVLGKLRRSKNLARKLISPHILERDKLSRAGSEGMPPKLRQSRPGQTKRLGFIARTHVDLVLSRLPSVPAAGRRRRPGLQSSRRSSSRAWALRRSSWSWASASGDNASTCCLTLTSQGAELGFHVAAGPTAARPARCRVRCPVRCRVRCPVRCPLPSMPRS